MVQFIYRGARVARDALHAELAKTKARPDLDTYTELFARHLEHLIVEGVIERISELPGDALLSKYRWQYLQSLDD